MFLVVNIRVLTKDNLLKKENKHIHYCRDFYLYKLIIKVHGSVLIIKINNSLKRVLLESEMKSEVVEFCRYWSSPGPSAG